MATPPPIAVLHHELPDPEALDLGPDAFVTETVLTAVCGSVTGEIDRVVSLDADGGDPIVLYETRIDGTPQGAGIAAIEIDSARVLAELAAIAGFMSFHLERLRRGDREPSRPHAMIFPTVEGGELTVDLAERDVVFHFGGTTARLTDQYARKLAQSISEELSR